MPESPAVTDERALCEGATPGPWWARVWDEPSGMSVIFPERGHGSVADVSHWKGGEFAAANRADATFIAHFNPTRVLALLDEVERLRADYETARLMALRFAVGWVAPDPANIAWPEDVWVPAAAIAELNRPRPTGFIERTPADEG